MAFEPGNQLGAKSKAFQGALRRAIAQDDGKRLRDAAEKLLTLAAQGEGWALKELADRLDGKSHQSSDVTIDAGANLLESIRRINESARRSDPPLA